MPICGFNKKMLEGLTSFHEGLVEHGIIERARTKGVFHKEIIERELRDMGDFLENTGLIRNLTKRALIENLTRYAYAFYQLVEQEGVENFQKVGGDLTKLYEEMDRKYYSELEGQPDAMRKLAEYLNQVE
ncbi:MAG: hypothetical protein ABIH28_01345 [archaeon]